MLQELNSRLQATIVHKKGKLDLSYTNQCPGIDKSVLPSGIREK